MQSPFSAKYLRSSPPELCSPEQGAKSSNEFWSPASFKWRPDKRTEVRPAIGGREGLTPPPVPSGRAPRFGRSPKDERAPRIRVSFGSLTSQVSRFRKRPAPERDQEKTPPELVAREGSKFGPMHPWRYKGAPPQAADVPTHSGSCPRTLDMDCVFKPFIRCFRSSRRADCSAQGTRLLRSRPTHVNTGLEEKCQRWFTQQHWSGAAQRDPRAQPRANATSRLCHDHRHSQA